MSRGKIKCKVVESTIQNKDVLDMFHEVLGTGEKVDLNPSVVYPKYLQIRSHCDRFLRLLEAFRGAPVLRGGFDEVGRRLEDYVAQLRGQFSETFAAPDLAAAHPPSRLEAATGILLRYEELTREEYDAFVGVYRGVKDCNLVNTIVVTCKNLLPHRGSLKDRAKLRDRFLRSPGLSLAPLPDLPSLNFKQIYISDHLQAPDRSFVLMVLHKLYTIGHDVYEAVLAPDVDVKQFVEVIVASLDDVKKAIPRCNEAFDKIRESVDLLEGNFGNYYKDYVASNNPTIIMENFVLDVSKNTKASPKITAQFRRIINYYREQAKLKADNPKLQTLFQQVDKNFQELERRSREEPEDAGDSSEEDEEPGGGPVSEDRGAPGGAAEAPPPSAKAAKRAAKKKKRRREKKEAAEEAGLEGRNGGGDGASAPKGHSRVFLAVPGEDGGGAGEAPEGASVATGARAEGAGDADSAEEDDAGAEDAEDAEDAEVAEDAEDAKDAGDAEGAEGAENVEDGAGGVGASHGLEAILAQLQGLTARRPEDAVEAEDSEGEGDERLQGEAAEDAAAEEALAKLLGERPEAAAPASDEAALALLLGLPAVEGGAGAA